MLSYGCKARFTKMTRGFDMKNRIEAIRKERGIRQDELAKLMGVSRQTISQIERGDYSPSVTLALKLAMICQVTVEDLFSYEED